MTLDEAIKHCEERAKINRELSEVEIANAFTKDSCRKCAEEHEQLANWLKELKAYKENSQGDLISREALKKAIKNLYDATLDGIVKFGIEKAYKEIENTPAAVIWYAGRRNGKRQLALDYLRPKGKWVGDGFVFCDQCGASHGVHKSKFCPNCGADMRGDTE